jgi:hypothetical protein
MPTTRDNDEERRIDRLVEQSRTQNPNSEMRRGLPSRERAVMPARTTPENGDIVVREEKRKGTLVYALHTAPGADQYLLRVREEAVAQAVTFAQREGVRAWLTDEGYDFVLLEDFRAVESV